MRAGGKRVNIEQLSSKTRTVLVTSMLVMGRMMRFVTVEDRMFGADGERGEWSAPWSVEVNEAERKMYRHF